MIRCSYNELGKLSSYTKTEDSYEIETWNFTYGPHGLEYAEKIVNSESVLTQDFTTDPYGRILSMTYDQEDAAEGVNGEYYFHYDNFGNTTMLTDASGNRQFAALYDVNNGKIVDEWNPNALAFQIKGEGWNGGISIDLPNESSLITDEMKAKIKEQALYIYLNAQNARNMAEATEPRSDDENPCSDDPCKPNKDDSCRTLREKYNKCGEVDPINFGGIQGYCDRLKECISTLSELLTKNSSTNICLERFGIFFGKCWDKDLSYYTGRGDEGRECAKRDLSFHVWGLKSLQDQGLCK
jgi:hypothetical protein